MPAFARSQWQTVFGCSAYICGLRRACRRVPHTYQPARLLHERPVHAVHLVVQPARVAQVVARAVPPPQGRVDGAAVHALAPLAEVLRHLDWGHIDRQRRVNRRYIATVTLIMCWATSSGHGNGRYVCSFIHFSFSDRLKSPTLH